MTSRQEAKLNMYRSVQQLCNDHNTLIQSNAAVSKALLSFTAKINNIISTATSESQVISGISIDKSVAKRSLAQNATDIAGIVFAYASSISNNKLKQEVNYAYSDFTRIKDDLLVPTANNIYKAANDHLADLASYGVTAAMLTSLQTSMDDYSNIVPRPKTARSMKLTYTDNIKTLITETDAVLKDQLDKLVVNFKITDPRFTAAYKKARVIIDEGGTATQIKGNVANEAGEPVGNAKVSVIGVTSLEKLSTKAGRFFFKPIAPGQYKIIVSADGYKNFTDELIIKLGQITNLTAILKS